MTKNNKILIATGGTGGHVFPAYSLARNFIRNNYIVKLTTDIRGFNYLKDYKDLDLTKISSSPLNKKNLLELLFSIAVISFSVLRSIIFLLFNRPSIVFGVGGYSSFPVCIAAAILRINFVIYENNLIIGKANKYLLPFAKKIFVSYKELEGIPKKYNDKIDSLELITMPRILGYAFNPVSFIFCYYRKKLICTILKVNNTFSENHYYINYVATTNDKYEQNYDIEKLFHVSPFLPREGYYKIKYKNNEDCINFNIDYYDKNNEIVLETHINGKKIDVRSSLTVLANVLSSTYLVTRVIYLIHFQAIKLFLKKIKFYKKPKQNINKIS